MKDWKPPPKTTIDIVEVIVISPKELLVDGINVGNFVDAMANMPQFAAKFQVALEAAWNEKVSPSGDS